MTSMNASGCPSKRTYQAGLGNREFEFKEAGNNVEDSGDGIQVKCILLLESYAHD